MKLNNKGFTMIELLAAITLLGILSAIGISSYTRYQEKAREEAYEAMESSAFSAAQNYILEKGLVVPVEPETKEIEIQTLVEEGFLTKLEDPRQKETTCHVGSKVLVSKIKNNGTTLEEYTYKVIINCADYTSSHTDAAGNEVEGKIFKG